MHAVDLTQLLVVEDEMIVALDLTRRLTRWGHTVTQVTSGAAAVDAADMLRPRLVFIDVHLPDAMEAYKGRYPSDRSGPHS
jgi:CheY-like chemotaxis protein